MNNNLQKTLIVGNVIAIVVSIWWLVNSNYDYEPIILTITLFLTILALIFKKTETKKTINQTHIKSARAKLRQKNKSSPDRNSENIAVIEGDDADISQKIE